MSTQPEPTLPQSMLAWRLVEFHKPYLPTHLPVPSPSPHELLIRIAAASLCYSDFEIAAGIFPLTLPITASHEGAGTVVALGSAVTGWKVGERVMCPMHSGLCGECEECRGDERDRHYCASAVQRGVQVDGAFAEFMLVDADQTIRLPDEVAFEEAAPLACAGRTIYRAVITPGLTPGQTLCIIGSGGGLGHIGIQFAKALGLRVIGIDARDSALALSRSLGADLVLDARSGQDAILKAVHKFTGSAMGADATVNTSNVASTPALACAITRKHGMLVNLAVARDGVLVPWHELVIRDIRVRGIWVGGRKEAEEMLALVAKNGVSVRKRVWKGLECVGEMVESAKRGGVDGKAVVTVEKGL